MTVKKLGFHAEDNGKTMTYKRGASVHVVKPIFLLCKSVNLMRRNAAGAKELR